jgi:hypothetical protein
MADASMLAFQWSLGVALHPRSSVLTHELLARSRYWIIWVGYYGAMRLGPAGFMPLTTRAVEKSRRSQDHVGEQTRHYMRRRLFLDIGEMRLGCIHTLGTRSRWMSVVAWVHRNWIMEMRLQRLTGGVEWSGLADPDHQGVLGFLYYGPFNDLNLHP